MDNAKLLDYAKNVTVATLLLAFVYLSYSRKIVWGSELEASQKQTEEMRSERDRWMNLAIKGTSLAERQSGIPTLRMMQGASPLKTTPSDIQKRLDRIENYDSGEH